MDVVIDYVGGDRDPAVFRQVVADGVVDQVLGESFQEYWVTCDRGGPQMGADVDVSVLRGALGFRGDVQRATYSAAPILASAGRDAHDPVR